MNISKNDFLKIIEKTVRDYYLIKEFEGKGLLVKHGEWYEAKSKEAADALSSFSVSIRSGQHKGNYKIKLPSNRTIEQYEQSIKENKKLNS